MNCIFCKIRDGEIPSSKVYEDDYVVAFLDTSQATQGHTLVIPKKHVDDIFDYDAELAAKVFSRIPKIATAIQRAFPDAKGLNIINNNGEVAYQSVFHSHIHLIPRYTKEDGFKMSMADNTQAYSSDEFKDIAKKIADVIDTL